MNVTPYNMRMHPALLAKKETATMATWTERQARQARQAHQAHQAYPTGSGRWQGLAPRGRAGLLWLAVTLIPLGGLTRLPATLPRTWAMGTPALHGRSAGGPALGGARTQARPRLSARGDMWTRVADLTLLRGGLAAARGGDGRIYAIGGEDSTGTVLNTVEAYGPRADGWTTVASLPTPREGLAAAAGADGRIYAIGGDDHHGTVLDTVEAYDPRTNEWTTVASLPTPRQNLAAAAGADGRIYAIGGYNTGSTALNTVEAYDPRTDAWTTVASLPAPRQNLAAAAGPDGRIYAIDGRDSNLDDVSTVEAYDPRTNAWTTVASLRTQRSGLAAATGADGRIYAMGGSSTDTNGYLAHPAAEAYDPRTNAWTTVAALPTERWGLAGAAGADGRIYAIGGFVENDRNITTPVSTVEAYTSWRRTRPARPVGCAALGAYPTGPRVVAAVARAAGVQPPPSPWRLVGTITLTAYSGCGHPSAGAFSVRGLLMGTPQATGGLTITVPCAQSCLGPPLAAMSATGTFRQDGQDPLSVTVTATLRGARATRGHAQAALGGVQGYVEVVPGESVRLTVLPPPTLSFLPAATADAGLLPVPLVIYGWRGM